MEHSVRLDPAQTERRSEGDARGGGRLARASGLLAATSVAIGGASREGEAKQRRGRAFVVECEWGTGRSVSKELRRQRELAH
jgi:hypothetical protein